MSTYTITDTPTQPLLGNASGSYSLVNLGNATIYLENDTAVSTLNGIPLPPTGQMTWDAGSPLFVVCASGQTSILSVNNSAGRIDASRAKFWQTLYTKKFPGVGNAQSAIVECAHTETLQIRLTERSSNATGPDLQSLIVTWYDGNQQVIFSEQWTAYQLQWGANPALSYCYQTFQVPVIGSYVSVQATSPVTTTPIIALDIFGTDRILSPKSFSSNPFQDYGIYNTDYFSRTNDQVNEAWTDKTYWIRGFTNYASPLFLACLSDELTITFNAASLTTGGNINLNQVSLPVTYQRIVLAAGSSITSVTYHVPVQQGLRLNWGNIAGGSIDLSFVWT